MALFEIKNLTFTYPDANRPALKEIQLTIQQGEFLLICGQSGCGKTTLLRHLKGVLTPNGTREGEICFCEEPLSCVSLRRQTSEIGFVLQQPDNQIVTDKVWHELAFGLENLGYSQQTIRLRVAEIASFFGIQGWFHKNVEELSGGQKQLLNLAAVMALQPRVLVLDEPTSQLDPIAAGEFLATIRKINQELGVTIIMTEHRLEEVYPMADKVLVLEEGSKLFYDTPQNVGRSLADHDLSVTLPTPTQVYNLTGRNGECPLTVCEGRMWIAQHFTHGKEQEALMESSWKVPKAERAIEAKNVWFRYEKDGADIVSDLTLQIKKGEWFCLLGGNGTGKTTTLSILAGLRRPYRGSVRTCSKQIGVLPQNPQTLFVGHTVYEDLSEMCSGRTDGEEHLLRVADVVEISHLLQMHPYDLSGGEQQRVALAKVLLLEPDILLLDEPTKGLDGFYKRKLAKILQSLQKKGVTIVMVSHDIEFCASYGERCALFFDGNIVTCQQTKAFFAGNHFYTTAANRMARDLFCNAVTVEDVVEQCRQNRK